MAGEPPCDPILEALCTRGLRAAYPALRAAQARLDAGRTAADRNAQGGDAGCQWDPGLVLRHAVNYWLATRVARAVLPGGGFPGPLVDVGAGAGAFSVWAGALLNRPVVMVEPDVDHRRLAGRAFPEAAVVGALEEAPVAPVVLSMEVLEHVERPAQRRFLAALCERVLPRGVLLLSTPDESGYPGGWSGYQPHVGQVTAGELGALLGAVTDWPVAVFRIQGPGFRLGALARWTVPAANRVWSTTQRHLPGLAGRLTRLASRVGRGLGNGEEVDESAFEVTPASRGRGTGLLAVVRAPG